MSHSDIISLAGILLFDKLRPVDNSCVYIWLFCLDSMMSLSTPYFSATRESSQNLGSETPLTGFDLTLDNQTA